MLLLLCQEEISAPFTFPLSNIFISYLIHESGTKNSVYILKSKCASHLQTSHKKGFDTLLKHTWVCYFSGADSKCCRAQFNQLTLPLSVLALSNFISFILGKLWGNGFVWDPEQRKQGPGFFFSEMSLLKAHTSICSLQQDCFQR